MRNVIRGIAATSILLAAVHVAAAELPSNLPKRKPGLWEMSQGEAGKPAQVSKMCIDSDVDATINKNAMTMGSSLCDKMDVKVDGGTVVADSVCHLPKILGHGGNTITSHGETVFEGDTAFHGQTSAHYDPAFAGKTDKVSQQSGHWVSACPADMKPGDTLLPNGMKVNMMQRLSHFLGK